MSQQAAPASPGCLPGHHRDRDAIHRSLAYCRSHAEPASSRPGQSTAGSLPCDLAPRAARRAPSVASTRVPARSPADCARHAVVARSPGHHSDQEVTSRRSSFVACRYPFGSKSGAPAGFHFGTQPSVTQEHPPSRTVRLKLAKCFYWMLLREAGCRIGRIENPRVGGSIPPLATI
jgi:hypothetical protein